MRSHVFRWEIRTRYETVGKIHKKLKCDLSEMNDYLWPRETLRSKIYSIKNLIVIIEIFVMIIKLVTQFWCTFHSSTIWPFVILKWSFVQFCDPCKKKINCTKQCNITEPKNNSMTAKRVSRYSWSQMILSGEMDFWNLLQTYPTSSARTWWGSQNFRCLERYKNRLSWLACTFLSQNRKYSF